MFMPTIKRILVPTDFGETADAALAYAIELATRLGARISLVHVLEDPDDQRIYSGLYVPVPPEMRADIVADVTRQLEQRRPAKGDPEVTAEILSGGTAKAIVAGARERAADLVVMGTHGRRGVAHMLLGSVAERVVRTAECPVLTVRQ